MNDHQKIIGAIQKKVEPLKYVHAFWLEGSVTQGHEDKYSDLDVWLEVDPDKMNETYSQVKSALSEIGPVDTDFEMMKDNDQRHIIYHIEGMSEFLTIDVNTQPFPGKSGFDEGVDIIKVIFNKDVELKFYPPKNKPFNEAASKQRILELYRVQRPNVLKNIRRNKPLEAKKYYDSILEITIRFFRRRDKLDAKLSYDFKHVYRDLPKDIALKLEYFALVTREDLERKLDELGEWLKEL